MSSRRTGTVPIAPVYATGDTPDQPIVSIGVFEREGIGDVRRRSPLPYVTTTSASPCSLILDQGKDGVAMISLRLLGPARSNRIATTAWSSTAARRDTRRHGPTSSYR